MAMPESIAGGKIGEPEQARDAVRPRVGVARLEHAVYPAFPPFHPSIPYPEYPFGTTIGKEPNLVYESVRKLLFELGYDSGAYETPSWNPLSKIINPGMCVVIKPNFVLSRHAEGKNLFAIITHPSVLRAVMDYCWIALKGEGQIIVADAPQYNCNFEELLEKTRLAEICAFYDQHAGPTVGYRDLRGYWSAKRHFPSMKQLLPGDPMGKIKVDLGTSSALYGKPNADHLYGAVYDRDETIQSHSGERHVYEISGTILLADVVISVPKLKVHKKVGVTLNAKGLVGIATNKNMVVHYTLGPPKEGGDQYPDGLFTRSERFLIKTERWMYDHLLASKSRPLEYVHRSIYWLHNHSTRRLGLKVAEEKRKLDAGNWYGNDSAWRMTVDLLRIFYFADAAGKLHDTPQRRLFSIVDGVIGGEGCGPLTPDPKSAGVLIAGENPLAVDLVATRLMGFDPLKIKIYSQVLENREYKLGLQGTDEIVIVAEDIEWRHCLSDKISRFLQFKPHPGWIGRIEVGNAKEGESHE